MGKKYYAVKAGTKPGVYTSYTEAKKQIEGFRGSQWKGFNDEKEAREYCRPRASSRGVSKPKRDPMKPIPYDCAKEERLAHKKALVEAVFRKAQSDIDQRKEELEQATEDTRKECEKALSLAQKKKSRLDKERLSTNKDYIVTGISVYDSSREAEKNYMGVMHHYHTIDDAIYGACGSGYATDEPQFRFTEEFSYVNNKNQTVYQVYTDGACSNNGQPDAKGAIGVCFGANHPKNASRPLAKWEPQTNQRAELAAILRAYEIIRYSEDKDEKLYEIHTDSAYALNAVTKWYKKWRETGWTHKDGEPVKHKDLIEDILELKEGPHCKNVIGLRKVKAHSDCEGNNIADELAKLGLIRVSYGSW